LKAPSYHRLRIINILFVIAVGAISVAWLSMLPKLAALFPICFAVSLLSAKYLARTEKLRYLLGAAALGAIFTGLPLLEYRYFLQIIFKVAFLFAYVYPNLLVGVLLGLCLVCLFLKAALAAHIPFDAFMGQMIGIFMVPVLCHSISYLIYRLLDERNAYRDLNVKLRAEIEQEYKERERVNKKMNRLDRLNLVGQMAASIGHEVRNPLTSVRGYLQYFERKDCFSEYRDDLQLMIEELDRANAIITEYLSLAKNKSIALKRANLNNILLVLKPMLEVNAIPIGHTVYFDLHDTVDIIMDESEIKQLVINLVRNGWEAMTKPGQITITTCMHEDEVLFSIRDRGPGIPQHIIDKLGIPFFSTKEMGTGLGLAVCFHIVERHGALIHFEPSEQGTTVKVIFRAAAAP
jgi:signal transduction histidine kinase